MHQVGAAFRPVVPVIVYDADKVDNQGRPLQKDPSKIQMEAVPALLDTGATMTCVTKKLADRLGLTVRGTRPFSSASHRDVMKNIYHLVLIICVDIKVAVKDQPENAPTSGLVPMSLPARLEVGEFVNNHEDDVQVIVGMDVIMRGMMSVVGHDRRITLAF